MAAENWPAANLHVELDYFWFNEFSMSHMVHSKGYLTWWLGIKAFINKDVFINKYIFICIQLVNRVNKTVYPGASANNSASYGDISMHMLFKSKFWLDMLIIVSPRVNNTRMNKNCVIKVKCS